MIRNNIIVFIIFLLAPIDWFSPTGLILREAGAKPFIPFLLIILLINFIKNPSNSSRQILKIDYSYAFLIMLLIGLVAFTITSSFLPEKVEYKKSQIAQFVNQSSMLMITFLCIKSLCIEINNRNINIPRFIFISSIIHIIFVLLEFIFIDKKSFFGLSLFKTNLAIERPSGLMSEPSYFGVFAAISASILLFCKEKSKYHFFTAWALILIAILIKAKTFFPVFVLILFYNMISTKITKSKIITYIFLLPFITASFYILIEKTAALDLSENLSSAMRIGSAFLAANVISEGYGLLGIGTGQFHFFYSYEYFPDFLFLSTEAINQADPSVDFRASTFNFFLRILLEIGLLGFIIFLLTVIKILKPNISQNITPEKILLIGALAFLLTQDTYCYPYLILGFSFLIKEKYLHKKYQPTGTQSQSTQNNY